MLLMEGKDDEERREIENLVYGSGKPRVIIDEDGDEMVAPAWYTEDTAEQRAAMAWFGKQGRSSRSED